VLSPTTIYLPDQVTPCASTSLPTAVALHGDTVDSAELFVRDAADGPGQWLSISARSYGDGRSETNLGLVLEELKAPVLVGTKGPLPPEALDRLRQLWASDELPV